MLYEVITSKEHEMAKITAKNADQQDFIALMNALARAHHRFSLFDRNNFV